MFRSGNPTLKADTFTGVRAFGDNAMTLEGSVNKTGISLLVLLATAALQWNGVFGEMTPVAMLAGLIGGFALVGALMLIGPLRRRDPDRLWRQGQVQLREGLRRRGLPVAEHHGPDTLAQQVRQRWGAAGEPLATRLQDLGQWRYARHGQRGALRPLLRQARQALRRLPPS